MHWTNFFRHACLWDNFGDTQILKAIYHGCHFLEENSLRSSNPTVNGASALLLAADDVDVDLNVSSK
jgi:hypothetical protein